MLKLLESFSNAPRERVEQTIVEFERWSLVQGMVPRANEWVAVAIAPLQPKEIEHLLHLLWDAAMERSESARAELRQLAG